MKFQIKDFGGATLYTSLNTSCFGCLEQCNSKSISIRCVVDGEKHRCGYFNGNNGSVFLCTSNSDEINSSRIFREKIDLYYNFIKCFNDYKIEIQESFNINTKRLLHNLISLNAHNMQELFSIVPQEELTGNIRSQLEIIKKYILNDPDEAASAILRVAKNNVSIKNEFSGFKKLYEKNPKIIKKHHNARKVVLNVLHVFFQDFADKTVNVRVKESEHKVFIDYESFHVALYHLIDNATKYTMPGSIFTIDFIEKKDYFKIVFDMLSLKIHESEYDKIYMDGYSGFSPQISGKKGDGLGMGIVKSVLTLNSAYIELKVNGNEVTYNGCEYMNNSFEISFER